MAKQKTSNNFYDNYNNSKNFRIEFHYMNKAISAYQLQ